MILAVIFDFDNTIYDYELSNRNALNMLFEALTNDLSCKNELEEMYSIINYNIKHSNNTNNKFNKTIYIKQLLEKLNIPLSEYYKYLNIYESNFKIKIYDYVIELFELLKNNNIKIAICSNNIFIQQMNKMKDTILQYIDYVETSDECGEEKPHLNIFLKLQNKLQISFENIAYIGDNYRDDILPSIELKMLPFQYVDRVSYILPVSNKYIKFGNFNQLYDFFCNYFKTIDEFVYLSKYFGQSVLNVQGQGGNISIKLDELLFIKSSGAILGNITNTDGYCIANNNLCLEYLYNNNANLKETKLFGTKIPSMETFFHSYMKKYTSHIHFTLSNIFFCSNATMELTNFKYNYSIVEYQHPGLLLAKEIQDKYTKETDIYFLKNHGIIITSDTLDELIKLYEYIYDYFNQSLNYLYDDSSFKINKHYKTYNKNKIIRKYDYPVVLLKNIIYCFPDLAIFVEKIGIVNKINKINGVDYNIIIMNDVVYLCADNITKLYGLIEIIDSYKILAQSQIQCPLTSVDSKYLNNMEQEKFRKI
jgi:putative hydrolase of the HAD superfamily